MKKCLYKAVASALIFAWALPVAVPQATALPSDAPAPPPTQVIEFLTRTVSWYRQLPVVQQLATEPADLTFVQENRRVADQVVALAFDYARAQAQLQLKQQKASLDQASTGSGQYQRMAQLSQKADQALDDTQKELQDTRDKLSRAVPANRKLLESQVAELESEVSLLQARLAALNSMVEFVAASNKGGMGLPQQIEELARSVPASLSHPQGAAPGEAPLEPSSTTNLPVAAKIQPAGIWGLTTDLLRLSSKRGSLTAQLAATKELSDNCKGLRKPLMENLRGLIGKGDQVFVAADSADLNELAQEKQQLDALTSQFKQTSAGMLPLSKIIILLDVYQRTLTNWKEQVGITSHDELRELLFRLGVLVGLIAVVLLLGELWRRMIFRYARDARRRYQFLLFRRIAMWAMIALIVVLSFATQLGSVATFAGLITAGVAVALQSVIVSVVAYFFLIGKYGIRVGDRVQISGVTGEVVEIGLVRIHVMELSGPGDSQPTGRVVAFSNSIVFQPTAGLFKQIPGTNFLWHELKLTLSGDTNYHDARERISQAVGQVMGDYKDNLESQRLSVERSLSSVSPGEFQPKVRLRYTPAGIEADVRYPVALDKASETDERLMRGVMAALDREPRLKLVGAEMASKASD